MHGAAQLGLSSMHLCVCVCVCVCVQFSKRRHLHAAEDSQVVATPPEAAAENTNAIFEKVGTMYAFVC